MGEVRSHFLDSGSFSIKKKAFLFARETGGSEWDYYETDEFFDYMDAYAAFVKKYKAGIDLCANVDVIPHPELTWRNQQYLEKTHGLSPIPVVHFGTDLKWLSHYMKFGYELIALGGLVGNAYTEAGDRWISRCFDFVCDTPKRLPKVKLHGFGVSGYDTIIKYPWWSVDSTTWNSRGAYGDIYVPKKRNGRFVFDTKPHTIAVSQRSPKYTNGGSHSVKLSKGELRIVLDWLEEIGLLFGKTGVDGKVVEVGISNCGRERRKACVHFIQRMQKELPDWPWPYKTIRHAAKIGFKLQ